MGVFGHVAPVMSPHEDSSVSLCGRARLPVSFELCPCVADSLVSAMIDGAFERDFEKEAIRAHLRHGDTVEEAQKAAFDDRFFMEMERGTWLE